MVGKVRTRWLALAATLLASSVWACASPSDDPAVGDAEKPNGTAKPDDPAVVAAAQKERPWEVFSSKGETYLSNVFYADAAENEQIMPWRVDGHTLIDRLIYPTIGNPNLYVKDDAADEFMTVLRIEPDAIAHLEPKYSKVDGSDLTAVDIYPDDYNGIVFMLVARNARGASTDAENAQVPGAGIYPIRAKKIFQSPEPDDMPSVLRQRHTFRFVFDQASMKDVPPGLYDVRFEVRKEGKIYGNVYEYQYNAVRVFDHTNDEYTALNVSDTQTSVGGSYESLTSLMLDDFVDAVNVSTDPTVQSAAFITFNGDLHNGGSPGTVLEDKVAPTYAAEAKRVINALKRLKYPIFLTPGNHDGYVSMGYVPQAVVEFDKARGIDLFKVINDQNDLAWPNYTSDQFIQYRAKSPADGYHRDLFTGRFKRSVGDTFATSFTEIPQSDRNMVLYDGFYQWQKSYGPLYSSWTFGKNHYVSTNTFDLRQHRRAGWGMYTVNYGGGMSEVQLSWLDREVTRARAADQDIVLLMHHDPRGGHNGKDFGYYFPQVDFVRVGQSALTYILAEKLAPMVCKNADVTLTVDEQDSCLHDGLQEWMAPDPEFDKNSIGPYVSSLELLSRISKTPEIRTMVLGHAHLNSLEIKQTGDPLIPNEVLGGPGTSAHLNWLETVNPVRRQSWRTILGKDDGSSFHAGDFDAERAHVSALLGRATRGMQRTLSGDNSGPHELVILRVTSNANLSDQKYGSDSMFGWQVFTMNRQAGGIPRLNRVTYMIHEGPYAFDKITTVDVDRTRSMATKATDNPVAKLFTW